MSLTGQISETAAVISTASVTGRAQALAGDAAPVPPTPAVVQRAGVAANAPVPREDAGELSARIAERLEKYLKDSGRDLEYRVDADAGATVITVRRSDTGEVVRQFPSEEALAWLQRLNEQSGTFVDEFA